ncbi:MAG: DNA polymerase III subunit gamma/tau, partial [Candidatus Kapaibacteriota bacterium]
MEYLVTARKWRPLKFDEVVGQEHITQTLKNAVRLNRIHHAYLFSGPRGVGKTTTARILARVVNCENPIDAEPCNKCESCVAILEGRSLDVIEIDGASNNSVDDIRTLRENAKYPPVSGKYKIYIIDEVHMLSTSAFNALLKILEEPPSHLIFIFATTEPHKVIPTILSRCQRFDFHRMEIN